MRDAIFLDPVIMAFGLLQCTSNLQLAKGQAANLSLHKQIKIFRFIPAVNICFTCLCYALVFQQI